MFEFKNLERAVKGMLANAPSRWTSLSGEIGDGRWFLRCDIAPVEEDQSIRRIWIEAGEYADDGSTDLDNLIVGLWDIEAQEICGIEKLAAWGVSTDMKKRTADAFEEFLQEHEPDPEKRTVRYLEFGESVS